jgi:hypothetical protein
VGLQIITNFYLLFKSSETSFGKFVNKNTDSKLLNGESNYKFSIIRFIDFA